MDDEYYDFTLKNSLTLEGLRQANEVALIVLKAKAFLNNRRRAEEGQKVQSEDIQKHVRDVIRLVAILTPGEKMEVPEPIRHDIREFIEVLESTPPNVSEILKKQGITGVTYQDVVDRIESIFGL